MTKVYYGKLSNHRENEILNEERKEYINGFKTEEGRRERINVWILLAFAVKNEFGTDIGNLDIKRNENGKWGCSEFCFSLSHSNVAVAVAVSEKQVGVDIERVYRKRKPIQSLNDREKIVYALQSDKDRAFAEIWTKKECIFKKSEKKIFLPQKTDSKSEPTVTEFVKIGEDDYCLSVTGDEAEFIEIGEENGLIFAVNKKYLLAK